MRSRTINCDANILIDYLNAGGDCPEAACNYTEIIVPDVVLQEVRKLNPSTAREMGINILEVPLDLLFEAENRITGCSMQDTVCFLLAKQNSWICATNDGKLRKQCIEDGIETVRGFRLLVDMVEAGCMTASRARKAGRQIAEGNREISDSILEEFYRLLP